MATVLFFLHIDSCMIFNYEDLNKLLIWNETVKLVQMLQFHPFFIDLSACISFELRHIIKLLMGEYDGLLISTINIPGEET